MVGDLRFSTYVNIFRSLHLQWIFNVVVPGDIILVIERSGVIREANELARSTSNRIAQGDILHGQGECLI